MTPSVPGTVIIYGPHYTREGFGLLARTWAMALHASGVNVKIVPVNCQDINNTGGLDDLDWPLLRSLEQTPIVPPVTAIFAYVPIYRWPKMALPEPALRVILTTFDSASEAALPQPRLVFICNQMDQVWVVNPAEEQAWIQAGLAPQRLRSFKWPHLWLESKLLPQSKTKSAAGQPFRFLHISLFLPRRRLDVLLRAFFEEFRTTSEAELYLKMTYPSWHPKGPDRAKKDLADLIGHWRNQTGSQARVVVDDELGTRLGLVDLIDSSDAYVSPDVVATAPVGEAMIRKRPVIISEGLGIDMPPQAWVVPNTTEKIRFTPEMAEYMPHFKGTSFLGLNRQLMRRALRQMYSLRNEERQGMAEAAHDYLMQNYSFAATAPAAIAAIREGLKTKSSGALERVAALPSQGSVAGPTRRKTYNIHWCGLQLFHGRLSTANREICLELLRRGHELSIEPGNGPFHVDEIGLEQSVKFTQLAARFCDPLRAPADFNVCSRVHPILNERPATQQILINTWWGSALPRNWVKPIIEQVQEVWVPSRFVRDNLLRAGIPEQIVQVIPFGFDPSVFQPQAPPMRLKTRKRFKFLFVGEGSSRKGLDLLLQAYLKLFSRKDDVCLVVKDMNCEDYYARRAGQDLIRRCQSEPGCPEIEYLECMLEEEELAGLYTACNCFVQPFRTAGFGLAILEAMACGLPVITTGYGGVLDFCDDAAGWLLPTREIRQYSYFAGPWRINSDLLHGRIEVRDLQDRMEHLYRHPQAALQKAEVGRARAHNGFTWARTADRILERFDALARNPSVSRAWPRPASSGVVPEVSAPANASVPGPTLVVFAPFYNRSGYGVAARSLVSALHSCGKRIRIVPVDGAEPGIDDCDLEMLRSLEATPVTTPSVALFFHVPNPNWLKIQLPPGSPRILFTTFDSSAQGNLPPKDWVSICNQMDQVWLMTPKEASIFAAAGVREAKIKVITCPHPWVKNPCLPEAPLCSKSSDRFRFLSIAMFQPRRRWDSLIEAYLSEFKQEANVELYLKVNYPVWHPKPGQPQQDLRDTIERLRAKTGSQAALVLDEALDTRLGICRLLDSCQAYVTTDTTSTAPVGEAFARGKIAVLPRGYDVKLPYGSSPLLIDVDPRLCRPMTKEELLYQPHHRGCSMPLLRVDDVRRSLRSAFDLPKAQREEFGRAARNMIESACSPDAILSPVLGALDEAIRQRFHLNGASPSAGRTGSALGDSRQKLRVNWQGTFLDFGSLSHVNRESTKALELHGDIALAKVSNERSPGTACSCEELKLLAKTLHTKAPPAFINIHHAWPPDWRRPSSGKLVVMQPWEFGALPVAWMQNSREVDEFWVPSTHVRQVYIESGIAAQKVQVVPNGIDPEKFRPGVKPLELSTSKSFKFLFVGGTIGRKGADVLLDAYLRQFRAEDHVCLVIKDFGGKTFYSGQTMEARIKAAQARPNAPEILYLDAELPPEALPGLYTACDCLVHPYRGEGFGLPILEAMACGLPVIVTAGGAADDFAKDGFAYRIPATRRNIGDTVSGMKLTGPGWLLEPDPGALAARMKWVLENRTEARELGQRASNYARRQWTWENAARCARDRLRELQGSMSEETQGPTRRAAAPVALPPVGSLGHLAKAGELLSHAGPREAWEAAVGALKTRPYHPEALLVLAEIAASVGDGQEARLCAQHARRLAPEWKPARQFLNRPLKGNSRPSWLVLPPVTDKAPPRLTVCVIAKNEERFLQQCLESVKPLADQLIVVDTGSTDRTLQVAESMGAEVHQFAWGDDFSAARNAALEHARGDWVLILDADEELPPDQHARLRADLKNRKHIALRLPLVNQGQEAEGCSYVPRLFRNAPGVYFTGRIHEQVFPSLVALGKTWGLGTGLGTAQILHHGYTKEAVKDRNKVERNLKLLRLAVEEDPTDANLAMNLGLETVRAGDLPGGLLHYRRAFELVSAKQSGETAPELREALLTQFTAHLYKQNSHREVVEVLTSPLAKQGGLTASLHFALGLACFELGDYFEAAEQMRRCLAKRQEKALTPINTDILTAAPHHCLALSLAKAGDSVGAEKAFQAGMSESGRREELRLDYARFLVDQNRPVDALHRLHELSAENGRCAAAWRLGGQIALSRADFLEFACDWTSEAIKQLPEDPELLSQRAEVLLLNQQVEPAVALWRVLNEKGFGPRAQAACLLCDIIAGRPCSNSSLYEAEVGPISREFIAWYQRCLAMRAQPILSALNQRLEMLRPVLPAAASMIEAALAEATGETVSTQEPCLA